MASKDTEANTRPVVVDDEPLSMEIPGNTLSARQDLEVVGMPGDGESVALVARQEKPDVVLKAQGRQSGNLRHWQLDGGLADRQSVASLTQRRRTCEDS